jgi:hypothetical protein
MGKLLQEEEDEVLRCRRVRDQMDRRFRTLDEAFARLEALAKLRSRPGERATKPRARRREPAPHRERQTCGR